MTMTTAVYLASVSNEQIGQGAEFRQWREVSDTGHVSPPTQTGLDIPATDKQLVIQLS